MRRKRKQVIDDRPCLREQLGVAVNARSLGDDPERVTAADRVGALATASNLGSLLVHIKYGGQMKFLPDALIMWMDLRLRERQRRRPAVTWGAIDEALHAMALVEWVLVVCQTCKGTGRLGSIFGRIDPVRITCGTCGDGGIAENEPGKRPTRVADYFCRMMGAFKEDCYRDAVYQGTCPDCHGVPIWKTQVDRTVHICGHCYSTGLYTVSVEDRLNMIQFKENEGAEAYGREPRVFTKDDWEKTLQPVYQMMLDDLKQYDKEALADVWMSMRKHVDLHELLDMKWAAESVRAQRWLRNNPDAQEY